MNGEKKIQMKKATILCMALFVPLLFYAQDIDYAEYFIDSDPGYESATPIGVSATGSDISLDFNADIAVLQPGIHYLVIRARDDQGQWSQGSNTVFYLVESPDVSGSRVGQAEYFIDTDPGFGNAISIPVPTPGENLTLQISPGLEGLDQGIHYMHFRARDLSGRWGSGMNAVFLILDMPSSAESEIQQVEYFIDTDPGFGLGTPVLLPSTGRDLTIDFSVSLTGMSDGDHVLYIRAKNALHQWGQVYAEAFSYTSTGTGEGVKSLFKVYPNPSTDRIQIELSDQASNGFRLKLVDMNGKLVYEREIQNNLCELDLELPAGMYLLHIESAGRSFSQKIILE
jgi:hypothetical protein